MKTKIGLKKPKRVSKYGVAPKKERTYKGVVYMSKLEMDYRKRLELLQKAKYVKDRVVSIEEQVPFPCTIQNIKTGTYQLICKYVLDFKVTYEDGRVEYVDVKGVKTSIYALKKKLVEALYGIKIKEVRKGEF